MKNSRLLSAACACLAAASFNAGAVLVSQDLITLGDGLITVDTGTGMVGCIRDSWCFVR